MARPQFSEILADRRRQLGFSTAQASRVLRLKEDVLIAFEEGDFASMPKSGYAQGMLSSYARYLGLDAAQIVELYAEEQEVWRRESAGRRKGGRNPKVQEVRSAGVGQPYVAARGLLPTSGGPAGDMGSFATTRVRTRGSDSYGSTDEYIDRSASSGYSIDAQNRPYTRRAPERRSSRRREPSSWDDIQTRGVQPHDYEDDLHIGMQAQTYRSASSNSGRRSSRNISRGNRQRVRSASNSRSRPRRDDRRKRDSSRNRHSNSRQSPQFDVQAVAVIGAAIAVISVILVVSISSCVNSNFNTSHTVPVNQATSASADSAASTSPAASASSSAAASSASASATSKNTQESAKSSSSAANAKTPSVTITVADGGVTWLEVECDGKSEVAQQVTGPWENTYQVEESLTVQASDTTSVTVVQDGEQLQFDPKASGIGTIHVEGSKKSSSKTSTSKNSSSSDDEESATEEEESNDSSDYESDSKSSSRGNSASMGNHSTESTKSDSDESSYSNDNEDLSEYDNYDYSTY